MILWVTEKPQLDKKLKPGSACTDQIWREKEGVKHRLLHRAKAQTSDLIKFSILAVSVPNSIRNFE